MKAYLIDAGDYEYAEDYVDHIKIPGYARAIGIVFAETPSKAWNIFFNDTENEYWKYLEYTERKSIRRLGKEEYDHPAGMLTEKDYEPLDENEIPSLDSLGEILWSMAYKLIGYKEQNCRWCGGTGEVTSKCYVTVLPTQDDCICDVCGGVGKVQVLKDGILK